MVSCYSNNIVRLVDVSANETIFQRNYQVTSVFGSPVQKRSSSTGGLCGRSGMWMS
jgi:hypothetical protein